MAEVLDLPAGECICTTMEDRSIRVDRADPRILISAEVLDAMAADPAPGVWLDTTACCDCFMQDDYTGAVLKIAGVNRTVIYRITGYVPAVRAYIGEWPD